jgi:periplasmic protein TonB
MAANRLGTMRQETFNTPVVNFGPARTVPSAPGRRFLIVAALLSIVVHLSAGLLILFLPAVWPREPRSQEQGTVELLMVEQKGAEKTQSGGQPPTQPAEAPAQQSEAMKSESDVLASATKAIPALPPAVDADQATGTQPAQTPQNANPTEAKSIEDRPRQESTQPATQEAPIFDLEGTESQSNAIAFGSQILPAMPDNRFRNRPPVYPAEAETRGQHGAVVVLIHVSANGTATGVDVIESSGIEILDQAAVTAVRKWHFHPAMKAGLTVPFDMPFRFVFEAN